MMMMMMMMMVTKFECSCSMLKSTTWTLFNQVLFFSWILLLLLDELNQPQRHDTLVLAKKKDDEHLFLHMPEGGTKLILPIPLFLPVPFPIVEDIEKIYHKKKVLVVAYPKYKKPYKPYSGGYYKTPSPYGTTSAYGGYNKSPYPSSYAPPISYDTSTYGKKSTYYDQYGSASTSQHDAAAYAAAATATAPIDARLKALKRLKQAKKSMSAAASTKQSSVMFDDDLEASAASSSTTSNQQQDEEPYGSSSDYLPTIYHPHINLKDDFEYAHQWKNKKKVKKTTLIQPWSEYESPTKYYPYDADEGEDVEHVEYSSDDGKSKDINPKNIIDKIRKFLTKENVKLKVNIDYNKNKLKHDKKEKEKKSKSIGKVIDEQIKKLEHELEEEYHNH